MIVATHEHFLLLKTYRSDVIIVNHSFRLLTFFSVRFVWSLIVVVPFTTTLFLGTNPIHSTFFAWCCLCCLINSLFDLHISVPYKFICIMYYTLKYNVFFLFFFLQVCSVHVFLCRLYHSLKQVTNWLNKPDCKSLSLLIQYRGPTRTIALSHLPVACYQQIEQHHQINIL